MKKSLGDIFSLTWKDIRSNWKVFLKVFVLFGVIPALILFIISFLTSQPVLTYIILVVAFFVLVVLFKVLIRAILLNYSFKDKKKISSEYEGKKYFWKLFGLYLVEMIVYVAIFLVILGIPLLLMFVTGSFSSVEPNITAWVIFGLLLLILFPVSLVFFVYFAVKWAFSDYILVNENTGVIESLRRSWRMTKGRFWLTLGILALCILILIAISFTISIINSMVTMPVTLGYGANSFFSSQGEATNLPFSINLIVSFINQVFGWISSFIVLVFGILFVKNFYLAYKEEDKEKSKIKNK